MTVRVRSIQDVAPRSADVFGGKAAGLASLARGGFLIPSTYAVSVDACASFFRAILAPGEQPTAWWTQTEAPDPAWLASIRKKLLGAELPSEIALPIERAFDALREGGAVGVAVRSSSTTEDRAHASAAGLHQTVLHVTTRRALFGAVRACFASVFTPGVAAYGRAKANEARAVERPYVGLILQAMVPAEVSGVLFTANPLTSDRGELLINASWGLGSAIVDGKVSPDSYRIDKFSGEIRDLVVGEKRTRVVLAEGGGVREEPVAEVDRASPCLGPAELASLWRTAQRIEAHFGRPRDIEFAFSEGALYALQARPITTFASLGLPSKKTRAGSVPRSDIVWSNVNVGEALPGVATPLTWSVLSRFSDTGFRRAFGALGCSVPKDAELVGNFRGRIYLNLTEVTAIASQVPGLRPEAMLSLGGGGAIARLDHAVRPRDRGGFFFRLPATLLRFARENAALGRRLDRFDAEYAAEKARITGVDFRILAGAGLAATLRDIEGLLDRTGSIALTCYGNLLSTSLLLRGALRLAIPDRAEALERTLTSGIADLESAAPALALWHIAEIARSDASARGQILGGSSSPLSIAVLAEGPTRRALERFMTAYGFRGAREAELAEPRWSEDPSLIFASLRLYLTKNSSSESPLSLERRQRALRADAEAELATRLPLPLRSAIRQLLALAQRFLRLRERLRARVTEVLGMLRAVAVEASQRFLAKEPEVGADSAFFLASEELREALLGHVEGLAALVRVRRVQFDRDRALPDPPGTFTGYPKDAHIDADASRRLTGLAASAGRAEGIARVVRSATEAEAMRPGEILVAPYADVGWSPLFLAAGGIVTDLGGPLSHAAIVAREFGIPAVMNVGQGTQRIRTGDRVAVDGDAGTVDILR